VLYDFLDKKKSQNQEANGNIKQQKETYINMKDGKVQASP
jgi:hypothetical protein